jgi:hypothetical protein
MKNKLIRGLVALLAVAAVLAADLTYTTLPQTTDSALVLANKQSAALTGASNKFSNITTATTTTVKSGSGVLERIVVNTAGAGSTFVIYDNTAGSGTKIASGTSATQISLMYNVRFSTGLTIVTASGTPADITVIYK